MMYWYVLNHSRMYQVMYWDMYWRCNKGCIGCIEILAGCMVGCIRCIELSQDVLSDVMQMY